MSVSGALNAGFTGKRKHPGPLLPGGNVVEFFRSYDRYCSRDRAGFDGPSTAWLLGLKPPVCRLIESSGEDPPKAAEAVKQEPVPAESGDLLEQVKKGSGSLPKSRKRKS